MTDPTIASWSRESDLLFQLRQLRQENERLRTALAQPPLPVQEPVGKVVEISSDGFRCEFSQHLAVGTKLYIAPPLPVQPERQPLTDEWIESAGARWVRDGHDLYGFARAIEAAHGIKEQS